VRTLQHSLPHSLPTMTLYATEPAKIWPYVHFGKLMVCFKWSCHCAQQLQGCE